MRQFEEFGKVMAVIFGSRKQNDWEKFEKELNEAALKFTSFETETVEAMSLQELETKVLRHPTLLPEQKKMLADLLYEKMLFYTEKNELEKSDALKRKCAALYQDFMSGLTENEFNLDLHYKLEFLKKMHWK
jgi:hypothetical protein